MAFPFPIALAWLLSIFSMGPDGQVPIHFWPLGDGSRLSAEEQGVLAAEIRRLDLGPYHRVAVQARRQGGRVGELELYLLSRERYSAQRVRWVRERGDGWQPREAEFAPGAGRGAPVRAGVCPDGQVQVLLSSCEQTLPSAMKALETAGDQARQLGFRVAVLRGEAETRQALLDWYACPKLVVHGRVGHGLKDRIVLADGILSASDFASLGPDALQGKALYYNSCLVHNPPLEPALMGVGAQVFIGGNVELWIGPSEDVFTCWVERALAGAMHLQLAVRQCEQDTAYLQADAHGTSKDPYQPAALWPPLPQGAGPRARFTVGVAGRTVTLRDHSETAGAEIAGWQWSFGDGSTSSEPSPVHGFGAQGIYPVTLTVRDEAHRQSSWSQWVVVDEEPGGGRLLHADTALEGLGGKQDSATWFKLFVPEGLGRVEVRLWGGYGDADLAVRQGAMPAEGVFDCASALPGNEESCVLKNPAAGVYHAAIVGGTYFGDVSIMATFR